MGRLLLLLFVLVPLVEIALLLRLAGWIGGWSTFAIVVATGVAGGVLVRRQGLTLLRLIREDLAAGRMPADRILSGLLLLLGGALLLTPGVVTDVAGLLLMVPGNRRFLAGRLRERIRFDPAGHASFVFFRSGAGGMDRAAGSGKDPEDRGALP